MQSLLMKISGKKPLKKSNKTLAIDFIEHSHFQGFDQTTINYITKNKNKKSIEITDYIFPLVKLTESKYQIKDHINLSGYNPLKGPQFISLTNIYNSKKGIVVVGLKEGVVPNDHEKKVLLKAGVKAYCYNLVPTVILAASLGLKIKAFGIVKI